MQTIVKTCSFKRVKPMTRYILLCQIIGLFVSNISGQITNFTPYSAYNYVYSRQHLLLATSGKTYRESFQFYDGLGRLSQVVDYKGSPLQKDIIQPKEYDAYGRETNKYLPYASTTATGNFRPSWKTEQTTFYTTTLGFGTTDGSKAFAQTIFDNSPANRIKKQGAPGNVWRIISTNVERQTGEHILSYQYAVNTTNEVYYWAISGTYPGITFTRKTFSAAALMKTITSDENNNPVTQYKDKEGNVVLKTDALGGKTYYVYDQFNLLRLVIPPLATQSLATLSSFPLSNVTCQELCYYYDYDNRKRMIRKKIPGTTGVYYMVYDDLDRLTRTDEPNGNSLYYKYDVLSRTIETGVVVSSTQVWQTKTIYDTYVSDQNYTTTFPYQNVYYSTYETAVKGKITVTKTKVTNPEADMKAELISVTYYDKYGRVIQVISENHKNGRDCFSYKYLHKNTDLIAETKLEHGINGTTYSRTIVEKFTYDHAGRLKTNNHKINADPEINLATKGYNESGVLKTESLGGFHTNEYGYNIRNWLCSVNSLSNCAPFNVFSMQLTYTGSSYNGNITKMEWTNGTSCFVKIYNYTYDKLNRLTGSAYSEIDHGVNLPGSVNKYSTAHTYDLNGNIKTTTRYGLVNDGAPLVGKIDEMTYVYGNSGNSNRLWAVSDAIANVSGRGDFNESGSEGLSTQEFIYDNNGNLTWDYNRSFKVSYNFLNLPYTINQEDGTPIFRNMYSATGTKLRQKKSMGETETRDYIGPFVYKDGVLEYIITNNGRAVFLPGGQLFSYYEFHLKDHLGNVRTVIKKNGTTAEVLQKNDYYPFGMVMGESNTELYSNKYLYNGKEVINAVNSTSNIDMSWYDYGARFYDPQIGRWHSVDPLAEVSRRWSPYTYCYNNPIRFIDPDGMLAIDDDIDSPFHDSQAYTNKRLGLSGNSSSDDGGQSSNGNGYEDPPKPDAISGADAPPDPNFVPSETELVPSGQGGIGWLDAASVITDGSGLTGTVLDTRLASELTYRKSNLLLYSNDINTGKQTWLNPKYVKGAKWTGLLGGVGDFTSVAGAGYNMRATNFSPESIVDFIFSGVGCFPVAGDIGSLLYTGAKSEMKWKQWYIDHNIDPTFNVYNPSLGF